MPKDIAECGRERRKVIMSEDVYTLQNRDNGAGKLTWFVAGAVLGATVALLYAPKSGKETRRLISDTTNKGREAAAETSRDIVETSRDLFERGRKIVEDAAELFERGRRLVKG